MGSFRLLILLSNMPSSLPAPLLSRAERPWESKLERHLRVGGQSQWTTRTRSKSWGLCPVGSRPMESP